MDTSYIQQCFLVVLLDLSSDLVCETNKTNKIGNSGNETSKTGDT
ncbi:42881_t:CDS:2, partial [Gigaspora margarita]